MNAIRDAGEIYEKCNDNESAVYERPGGAGGGRFVVVVLTAGRYKVALESTRCTLREGE